MNKKQKEWISKNIVMPSALIETTLPKLQLELLKSAHEYLTWSYRQTDESFLPKNTGPELIRDIGLFLSSYASRIEACLIACDGLSTEYLSRYHGNQWGIAAALNEKSLKNQLSVVTQRDELLESLRGLCAAMACYESTPEETLALECARAAIAKATGGAA